MQTHKHTHTYIHTHTHTHTLPRPSARRSLEAMIKEKRGELDRYVSQYQSLERIESEQNAQIEKLTSAA